MRYVTFSIPGDSTGRIGLVQGDRVIDLAQATAGEWSGPGLASLLELVQAGPDAWARLRGLLSQGSSNSVPLKDVRCHAPIPRPSKNVFCLGLNYASHAQESSRAR